MPMQVAVNVLRRCIGKAEAVDVRRHRKGMDAFRGGKVMRLLIAIPLLLVLLLFALSNKTPVRLGIWPTDFTLQLPLSLAVLGGMAIAFLAGGLIVWLSELSQRRRARHAEQAVRLLEAQVQELKARLPQAQLPPPLA
jgi:lipopolysaccharide assembly protein A